MIKEPLFHVKQWLLFTESVKSIAQTSKLSERFPNNPDKPAYFTVLTYNEISRFIYSSGGFNPPTLCDVIITASSISERLACRLHFLPIHSKHPFKALYLKRDRIEILFLHIATIKHVSRETKILNLLYSSLTIQIVLAFSEFRRIECSRKRYVT